MTVNVIYQCALSSCRLRLCRNKNICRRACSFSSSFLKTFYSTTNSNEQHSLKYNEVPVERIRNFSIIAHVDHGKSTLADRLLEYTGTLKIDKSHSQVLDKLQVERERGITVKAQSVSISYHYKGHDYLLNLIDTPGHVDFSNEVSRSLLACQGVILLVDADDGVQAQTVANFYLAFANDLVIVPVLNKIDLKNANPTRVSKQLQSLFDINPDDILKLISEILDFLDASPASRNFIEGEKIINAGHLLSCGCVEKSDTKVSIFGFCLQTSKLSAAPHEIKGDFIINNGKMVIGNMQCSCKAGLGERCKHIAAVLLFCTRNDVGKLEMISKTEIKCLWNQKNSKTMYNPMPLLETPCFSKSSDNVNTCIPISTESEKEVLNMLISNLPDSSLALFSSDQRKIKIIGDVALVPSRRKLEEETRLQQLFTHCSNSDCMTFIYFSDFPSVLNNCCVQTYNAYFPCEDNVKISAKLGTGIGSVLEAVIERVPPPNVDRNAVFRALLFDCWYDRYRGALSLIYVKDGNVKVGDTICSCYTKKTYQIKSLSVLTPEEENVNLLVAGQIGLVGCNMRSSKEAHVGDTLHKIDTVVEPLQSFQPSKPMVFAGVYPSDQSQNINLRSAIEKLTLNDSSVTVAVDTSPALGLGWRLGFLGLLHLEVFSQRLEQEYGAEPVLTAPSVTYKIKLKPTKQNIKEGTDVIYVNNPVHFPESFKIEQCFEPMVLGTIITPDEYLGAVISLCMDRRGVQKSAQNIDNNRVMLQFHLPLNEIVVDFHDCLKSVSSGYASFDYEDSGYTESDLVKLQFLLNGVVVDELSHVVHVSRVQVVGRKMVLKLKEIIPKQLVQIAIQAVVNGKVVARETLKAYRKDVTAKLYGGDVTRRMKLLAQQAAGKKKMRTIANISIPRETFIDVLKK